MTDNSVYHEGELAVQVQNGAATAARLSAAAIQDRIPQAAMAFIAQQSMAAIGSRDAQGNVWASLVFGQPGFLHTDDGQSLWLQRSQCHIAFGDPLWRNLEANEQLGILLIELGTRRRLRINGNIQSGREKAVRIQVEQAYANCPKYIQRRSLEADEPKQRSTSTDIHSGQSLNSAQQAWISGADTFFVASAHPSHGADVSHRGGHPGFVKLLSAQRLRIPDFTGNNMFNTLGNFTSYPHAGLVFFDFDRGKVLQLCGRPEIYSQQADEPGESGGTARFWEFQIECWRESNLPVYIKSRFVDYSPFLPKTRKPDSAETK